MFGCVETGRIEDGESCIRLLHNRHVERNVSAVETSRCGSTALCSRQYLFFVRLTARSFVGWAGSSAQDDGMIVCPALCSRQYFFVRLTARSFVSQTSKPVSG